MEEQFSAFYITQGADMDWVDKHRMGISISMQNSLLYLSIRINATYKMINPICNPDSMKDVVIKFSILLAQYNMNMWYVCVKSAINISF